MLKPIFVKMVGDLDQVDTLEARQVFKDWQPLLLCGRAYLLNRYF